MRGELDLLYPFEAIMPKLSEGTFVAPGATVIGRVTLGPGASVWYNAVLRGDVSEIQVGAETNIQDLTMVHCDEGFPAVIGSRVTIGHSCIIHGCTIGDHTLIGMGTTILNGARIGENCLVGAGSLITEGKEFPAGSVIMGRPAKVIREVSERELDLIRSGHTSYSRNSKRHAASLNQV